MPIHRPITLAAAFLVLASAGSPSLAQSNKAPAPGEASVPQSAESGAAAETAQALPSGIEDVQVVGPWTDGTRKGVWRTVMVGGQENGAKPHFFVQRIEDLGASKDLLDSTEIAEIAKIDGTVVGYRADEPGEGETNSLTLFFDVVPQDGEIAETYELHFQPDAPYQFGPATN